MGRKKKYNKNYKERNNQEKNLEVYIFIFAFYKERENKWQEKEKWYLLRIKKLFPSNSEIGINDLCEIFLL